MSRGAFALRFESAHSRPMDCAYRAHLASSKCTTTVPGAVIIEALADDLSTADDDTTVAIMKRRHGSLLKAKGEIHIVGRHLRNFSY